jgi:hypothetical protein
MQNILNIPVKWLTEGVTGHYVHGGRMSLGLVELKQGSIVPLHSHPHEQITFILSGKLQMEIGGKTLVLEPNMYHLIPGDVIHSALALTDCSLIDAFQPVREDYRTQ